MDDRPAVVLAGNVGGGQHRDDAGGRAHGGEVDRIHRRVRIPGEPERDVQRAVDLRNVVDVDRLAGHVQVRRLVRMRRAGRRARRRVCHETFGLPVHPACAAAANTLACAAGSGSTGRVSRKKRWRRFCAVVIRYAALARMSVSGV